MLCHLQRHSVQHGPSTIASTIKILKNLRWFPTIRWLANLWVYEVLVNCSTELLLLSHWTRINIFSILIIKANEMQLYFGKELYTFQTDLLSIIRSLITVFTAIGICHTGYVACPPARSRWNCQFHPDFASRQST
jgi:hypothetical protein